MSNRLSTLIISLKSVFWMFCLAVFLGICWPVRADPPPIQPDEHLRYLEMLGALKGDGHEEIGAATYTGYVQDQSDLRRAFSIVSRWMDSMSPRHYADLNSDLDRSLIEMGRRTFARYVSFIRDSETETYWNQIAELAVIPPEVMAAARRARLRFWKLRDSELSSDVILFGGCDVDLVTVVEQLTLDDSTVVMLHPILSRWESQVDRKLRLIDAVHVARRTPGAMTREEARTQVDGWLLTIRDINISSAKAITHMLPEDDRNRFIAQWVLSAYRMLFDDATSKSLFSTIAETGAIPEDAQEQWFKTMRMVRRIDKIVGDEVTNDNIVAYHRLPIATDAASYVPFPGREILEKELEQWLEDKRLERGHTHTAPQSADSFPSHVLAVTIFGAIVPPDNPMTSGTIRASEVAEFSTGARLSEDAEQLLDLFYDEYVAALAVAGETFRQALERVGEAERRYRLENPDVRSPWFEKGMDFGGRGAMSEFWRERMEAADGLELAVDAILIDNHARQAWEQFCMKVRRRRAFALLASSAGQGPFADLAVIVDDLAAHILDAESCAKILDDYVSGVDGLLRDLEPVLIGMKGDTTSHPTDYQRVAAPITRLTETCVARINQTMDAQGRREVEEWLGSKTLARQYEQSPADLFAEAVSQEGTIDESVKARVAGTIERYTSRRAFLRARLRVAWERDSEDEGASEKVSQILIDLVELEHVTCRQLITSCVDTLFGKSRQAELLVGWTAWFDEYDIDD